jgi:hypothetical protein
MQYDYLLHSISKRKRFSKWIKPEENENLAIITEVFGYSDQKAREVMDLLPMKELQKLVQKGGQKR